MEAFAFDPVDGFNNTNSYPDPASGAAAREQLQSLHTQVQAFINDQLVPAINSLNDAVSDIQNSQTQDETDISGLQTAVGNLAGNVTSLQQTINGFATSFTTAGLRIVSGGHTYAISVVNGAVTATEVS